MWFSCFYVLLDSNFHISVICVHVSMFVRMLKIQCKPSERDGVLRCSMCFWSIWQLEFAKMAEVMLKGLQWLSWKIGSKTKGLQTRERSRSYWSGSVAAFEDLFSRGMQLGFCYVLFSSAVFWAWVMFESWISMSIWLFGALKVLVPALSVPVCNTWGGAQQVSSEVSALRMERHGRRKSFLGMWITPVTFQCFHLFQSISIRMV
jgi:hypothetical protein